MQKPSAFRLHVQSISNHKMDSNKQAIEQESGVVKQKNFQAPSVWLSARSHYSINSWTLTGSILRTWVLRAFKVPGSTEQCGWMFSSVTATCKWKVLIRSPVWMYGLAFWKNSFCMDWREPWQWQKACRPVSSSPCCSNQHSAEENFYCCCCCGSTDTHSHTGTDTNLQHPFKHQLAPSTLYMTCGACEVTVENHRLNQIQLLN